MRSRLSRPLTTSSRLCGRVPRSIQLLASQDGVLRCFYHGWAFGAEGKCVDVPTMTSSNDKKSLSSPSFCGTKFAVVEHEGMVYVWRGNLLAADVRKLPR